MFSALRPALSAPKSRDAEGGWRAAPSLSGALSSATHPWPEGIVSAPALPSAFTGPRAVEGDPLSTPAPPHPVGNPHCTSAACSLRSAPHLALGCSPLVEPQ